MDPVSPFAILSAVSSVGGGVVTLSKNLYSFIKAAKVVDNSVEELYREVQGLDTVFNTAQDTLTKTIKDHAQDPTLSTNGIWTSFKNGLDDCQVTVKALDSIILEIGVNKDNKNPFKKAFKQIKLSLSTDQIATVRSRVHTHSTCLQLALQMLDVSLSCSLRNDMKNVVIPDLEIIVSKLENLASAIAGPGVAQSLEDANLPIKFRNPDLADHTQRLKRRADASLTNASTVIGSGSVYVPDSISEFGVPLSTTKRAGIMGWTQELDMDEREARSMDGSSVTSVDQIASSNDTSSNPTMIGKGLSLRIVKDVFDKGEENWAKANYAEAEKFFRVGMDRVKTLSVSNQQTFNLNEIRLKIAFTRLHQSDFSEAIKLFTPLVPDVQEFKGFWNSILRIWAVKDDNPCENCACFGLAQAYLGLGSLGDAEIWCQKCNESWEATAERNADPLYSKSLQLMAEIHNYKGDIITANALLRVAIQEMPETDEPTPYMLDLESISASRVLESVEIHTFSKDFDANKSLSSLVESVGRLTPTEIAKAVRFLVKKGADPDRSLMKACECGNAPAVEQLCQSGANVNQQDSEYRTPLQHAVLAIKPDVVEVLCAAGASVHSNRIRGGTPLLMALGKIGSDYERLEIVKTLCKNGADVSARIYGKSMLDVAWKEIQRDAFSEVLKQYGAKDEKNKYVELE